MDDIHKLDVGADRDSAVSTGRQESQGARSSWHKPVLRRSDIAQYTAGRVSGTYDDGSIGGGYS